MNRISAVAVARVYRWQVARLALAAGVAAALAAGPGGSGGARAAAGTSGTGPASFSGLSCKGGSFCLATGSYKRHGHPRVALLEAWNGRTWRTFPKPRYYDNTDITCGGPKFCLAGTAPPGQGSRTVAWDGRTWRAFTPQPPDPFVVTCPTPRFCATYSTTGAPSLSGNRIVSWNGGTTWAEMPGFGDCAGPWCYFTSLSCATASICLDQGSYCTDSGCDDTVNFTGIWNGTTWGDQANGFGPGPSQACAGRSFCMTFTLTRAGASAAISRDWGNSWHGASAGLAAACHRAGCARLQSLSCGSSWSCVALTSTSQAAPADALIWNGATWKTARIARASGRLPALTMLSCGSPRNCAAIGTYQPATASHTQPIAEHWNGSAWHITPIPATP